MQKIRLERRGSSVPQWFERMPSNLESDPLIGMVLAGKYRIDREVGRGGMAAVFEARHVKLGKRVAVKVLNSELVAASGLVERFLREARAAAAIESPHICGMHDVDKLDDGRPFLVMDFLDGESLFQRLEKVRRFEPQALVQIFTQLCRGLQKAHDAGIVHRDLKPENVFLARNDEGEEVAKIVDFGLAKFYDTGEGGTEKRLTRDGVIFGTPLYMSPEQVVGDGKVDHRSDLWAMGCMAYECLTGRSVWNNSRGLAMVLAQIAADALPIPSKKLPSIPSGFDAWFARALDRDPDKRFQSARELASELAIALGFELVRPSVKSTSAFNEVSDISARYRIVPRGQHDGSAEPAAVDLVPIPPRPEIIESPPRLQNASVTDVAHTTAVRVEPARANRLWVIAGSVAVIGAVAGGYLLGARLLRKPAASPPAPAAIASVAPSSVRAAPGTPASPASAPPLASAVPAPSDSPAWMAHVRAGQDELSRGNTAEALKAFERAADAHESGITKLMLDHVRVTTGSRSGCRVTGLGRPRPFDQATTARHAVAVAVPEGGLTSWIDEHRGVGQPSVSAARFDGFLRTWQPVDLTPEGGLVTHAHLVSADTGVAFFWGEGAGSAAGLYARMLDARGTPQGAPVRLSERRASAAHVSAARAPSGEWWVAYSDDTPGNSANVFVRRLDASLAPMGGPVQVTELAGAQGPFGPRASGVELAIVRDTIVLSYRVERGQKHDIMLQRIPLSDPILASGVGGASKGEGDALVGAGVRITQTQWKVQPPEMACDGVVCAVAWQGEPSGVNIAAIDPASGEVRWRKVASASGMQAGVGLDGSGHGMVAWYEDSRLKAASFTLDGIGAGLVVGRVSGDHPGPQIAWISGSWLVGWSSFEGGHPEAYLARIACP